MSISREHSSVVALHKNTWCSRNMAGLQGFTRTLAVELGQFGITVNAVAPGFIDTEMTRTTARRMGFDPDERIAEAVKNIPVRRVGQPRDVANVICFLSSD